MHAEVDLKGHLCFTHIGTILTVYHWSQVYFSHLQHGKKLSPIGSDPDIRESKSLCGAGCFDWQLNWKVNTPAVAAISTYFQSQVNCQKIRWILNICLSERSINYLTTTLQPGKYYTWPSCHCQKHVELCIKDLTSFNYRTTGLSSSRHSPVKADPRGLPQTSWWLADCRTHEVKLDTLTCQFGSPKKMKVATITFFTFRRHFYVLKALPSEKFFCVSQHSWLIWLDKVFFSHWEFVVFANKLNQKWGQCTCTVGQC